MRLLQQPIEVLQRAEDGIHIAVIRHVVAEILHRRFEKRRQPNRIDSEIEQIGHRIDDSGEIADSVTVRVLKRPWINLVENSLSPPRNRCMIHVDSAP